MSTDSNNDRKARLLAYAKRQADLAKALEEDARYHHGFVPDLAPGFMGDKAWKVAIEACRQVYEQYAKRMRDDAEHADRMAKAARSLAKSPKAQECLVEAVAEYDKNVIGGLGRGLRKTKGLAALASRGLMRSHASGMRYGTTTYTPTEMGRALAAVMEGSEL